MKKTNYVRNRRTKLACAQRKKSLNWWDDQRFLKAIGYPKLHDYQIKAMREITERLRKAINSIPFFPAIKVRNLAPTTGLHDYLCFTKTHRADVPLEFEQTKSRNTRARVNPEIIELDGDAIKARFDATGLEDILGLKQGDISIRSNNE